MEGTHDDPAPEGAAAPRPGLVGADASANLVDALDQSLRIAASTARDVEAADSRPGERQVSRRSHRIAKRLGLGYGAAPALVRRVFAGIVLCAVAGAVGWFVAWLLG